MSGHAAVRGSALAACAALVFTLGACGSDSDTAVDTSGSDPATDATVPDDSGGPAVAALTAEEICERLTLQSVGSALGLDIGLAEPSTMDTPQCSYSYDAGGVASNVTVASMRPEDVGGLGAGAAFDYVVEINRMVAGDVDVEEVTLDAGDAAIRISGPAMHLGVVQVGDRVITVIVSADDASGPDVDSLIAKMSTALA